MSFLLENNYYMKLASYREVYEKDKNGKYINLDFAYLKELSRFDARLRYIIFHMTSDIEHFLKVKLLREIESNQQEDGYKIIQGFLSEDKNFKLLKEISSHKASGYCKELIAKYYPYFPVWVFVELITFGSLAYLCEYYKKIYNTTIVDNVLINSVRDLRNACAHNNCLINSLSRWDNPSYQHLSQKIGKISGVGNGSKNKFLRNKFVYDFLCLMYVYNEIVPNCPSKTHRYKELKELFFHRMRRNSRWFVKNNKLTKSYTFIRKILLTFL